MYCKSGTTGPRKPIAYPNTRKAGKPVVAIQKTPNRELT